MNKVPEIKITGDTLDEALLNLRSDLLNRLSLANSSDADNVASRKLKKIKDQIAKNNTVLLQAFYQAMILGPELLAEAKFKALSEKAYGVYNEAYEFSVKRTNSSRFIKPLEAFKGASMMFEEGTYNAFFGKNQIEFSSQISVYGINIKVYFYYQKKLTPNATKIDNVKFLFSSDGKPVGNLFNKGYFVNLDNGDKNVIQVTIKDVTTIRALKKGYYDRVDRFYAEKLSTDLVVKGLRDLNLLKKEIDILHKKRYQKENLNNKQLIEEYDKKVKIYTQKVKSWTAERNKVISK